MEPALEGGTPASAGSDDSTSLDGRSPGAERSVPWERLPSLLEVLGVAALASLADRWLVGGAAAAPLLSVDPMLPLATTVPLVVAFVYGGDWLRRSSIPVDRYRRIGYWCGGGLAVFLGISLAVTAVWWPGDVLAAIGWTRFALCVGGVGGLLFGVIEARAIERERAAERAETRVEMAEDQQQWFDYMNSLLRHEILNTASVLSGNVSLLLERDDLDEDAVRRLETVRSHCRDMELVIRDVRVLIDANNGNAELRPVDLAEVVDAEVRNLRDAHEDLTVEVDVPEHLPVLADELVGRVVSNLLANAVKHNDAGTPHVRIAARRSGERVVCRVEDDGSGVPERKHDILFERAHDGCTDHGLGLYLVRTLLDRYGGGVELTETGPEGSVFTVELPRAPATEATDEARATRDARATDDARADPTADEAHDGTASHGDEGTGGGSHDGTAGRNDGTADWSDEGRAGGGDDGPDDRMGSDDGDGDGSDPVGLAT